MNGPIVVGPIRRVLVAFLAAAANELGARGVGWVEVRLGPLHLPEGLEPADAALVVQDAVLRDLASAKVVPGEFIVEAFSDVLGDTPLADWHRDAVAFDVYDPASGTMVSFFQGSVAPVELSSEEIEVYVQLRRDGVASGRAVELARIVLPGGAS